MELLSRSSAVLDTLLPRDSVEGKGLNAELQDQVEDLDQAILGQVVDSQPNMLDPMMLQDTPATH